MPQTVHRLKYILHHKLTIGFNFLEMLSPSTFFYGYRNDPSNNKRISKFT